MTLVFIIPAIFLFLVARLACLFPTQHKTSKHHHHRRQQQLIAREESSDQQIPPDSSAFDPFNFLARAATKSNATTENRTMNIRCKEGGLWGRGEEGEDAKSYY